MGKQECCKNCKYYNTLKLFQRYVGTIGGIGCVCGWEVRTHDTTDKRDYGCCSVFLKNDSRIYETKESDICELWEEK